MITEAEKSRDLLSARWRNRKTNRAFVITSPPLVNLASMCIFLNHTLCPNKVTNKAIIPLNMIKLSCIKVKMH